MLTPSSSNEEEDKLIEEFNALLREQFGKKPEDLVGFIYLLRFGEFVKIGLSKNPPSRLALFRRLFPVEVHFEHTLWVADMFSAERWLHRRFAPKRARNEWFRLGSEDVLWVKSLKDGFYGKQP